MRDVGVIAYVTPGALFYVLRPENKDEQQVCSVVCICYGLAILIGWIAFHEVGWSRFNFLLLAQMFFSVGYIAEKIIYPVLAISSVFDEPTDTEDHF